MFKNYLGTQYLNVDVDIEAGEEASSTDGIIELEQIEYAESETSVHLAEEDFMDVDVTLEDLKQEDRIETILPVSPNYKVRDIIFNNIENRQHYFNKISF